MSSTGPVCPSCRERIPYGRGSYGTYRACKQCRRWVHRTCLAGPWCTDCFDKQDPTSVILVLRDDLLQDFGDTPSDIEYMAAEALAASILVGADEDKVRALMCVSAMEADQQALFVEVVANFRASNIWTKDRLVCLCETDGSYEQENMTLMLAVLCGTGRIVRQSKDQTCKEKRVSKEMRRFRRRRESGLCALCGAVPSTKYACDGCLEKRNARRREARERKRSASAQQVLPSEESCPPRSTTEKLSTG